MSNGCDQISFQVLSLFDLRSVFDKKVDYPTLPIEWSKVLMKPSKSYLTNYK
jgi:hypothetical protein